jgi:hypothetical protein
VKFGLPLRGPRSQRRDPWWCPVEISGLGARRLETVPGEDSLQALTLAMEYVTRVLPAEAERSGGRLDWLNERERLVFANTLAAGLLERSLQNCITGLADAVAALEEPGPTAAGRTVARRLRALIESGGYTADPRKVGRVK